MFKFSLNFLISLSLCGFSSKALIPEDKDITREWLRVHLRPLFRRVNENFIDKIERKLDKTDEIQTNDPVIEMHKQNGVDAMERESLFSKISSYNNLINMTNERMNFVDKFAYDDEPHPKYIKVTDDENQKTMNLIDSENISTGATEGKVYKRQWQPFKNQITEDKNIDLSSKGLIEDQYPDLSTTTAEKDLDIEQETKNSLNSKYNLRKNMHYEFDDMYQILYGSHLRDALMNKQDGNDINKVTKEDPQQDHHNDRPIEPFNTLSHKLKEKYVKKASKAEEKETDKKLKPNQTRVVYSTGPLDMWRVETNNNLKSSSAMNVVKRFSENDDEQYSFHTVTGATIFNLPAEEQDHEVFTHNKYEDTSVADSLFKDVRILCWVLTSPQHHETRALHIKKTWGRRCNKLLFLSTGLNSNIPTIALPIPEEKEYAWGKAKAAFQYVYQHHRDEADWFLKTDDETYVVVENLRHMLAAHDSFDPLYFGCRFKDDASPGYMSSKAGYVLSKRALDLFVNKGLASPQLCKQNDFGIEDIEMGLCLENLGVKAADTRDSANHARFFPFPLREAVASWRLKLKDRDYWWKNYLYYQLNEGLDCCSDFAVSFHPVAPEDMYVLEYLIYHLRPYGISVEYRLPKKSKKEKFKEIARSKIMKTPTKEVFRENFIKSDDEKPTYIVTADKYKGEQSEITEEDDKNIKINRPQSKKGNKTFIKPKVDVEQEIDVDKLEKVLIEDEINPFNPRDALNKSKRSKKVHAKKIEKKISQSHNFPLRNIFDNDNENRNYDDTESQWLHTTPPTPKKPNDFDKKWRIEIDLSKEVRTNAAPTEIYAPHNGYSVDKSKSLTKSTNNSYFDSKEFIHGVKTIWELLNQSDLKENKVNARKTFIEEGDISDMSELESDDD